MNDRDCLRALARARKPGPGTAPAREALSVLLSRYGPLVLASALRRTGARPEAETVTQAVFAVLARRARRLGGKTHLAGWLFALTRTATRRLARSRRPVSWNPWRWIRPATREAVPQSPDTPVIPDTRPDATPAVPVAFDDALDRLRPAERNAVLRRLLLEPPLDAPASPTQDRRAARGLRRMGRRLSGRGNPDGPHLAAELTARAAAMQQANPIPDADEWACQILERADDATRPTPWRQLANWTLSSLAWRRWRRRILLGIPAGVVALMLAGGIFWYVDSLTGHSRTISLFLVWSMKNQGKRVPGLNQVARPWPPEASGPPLRASEIRGAADLYQITNIWLAHLAFTPAQWNALEPERIDPLPHFLQPDGTALLRNPLAQRSGLAGVLGFDFHWSRAALEFSGSTFTNVGARVKGNGTYLGSLYGDKRSLKIDLNRYVGGQRLAGMDELNFHNLVNDYSYLSDALGYEFFREAGVPAPRTAYAYVSVSVQGQWTRRPLGLFGMVEPVDADFLQERFQRRRIPLFKPVTYDLFDFVGEEWRAYADVYDLKTKAEARQLRRVIEFARLTSQADDTEFARRVGEFLDLDAYARFLACQVLLSNYDGPLSTGQNFYLYLDPASEKFGFIPWDLDLSWGGFFLLGSIAQRERASIWHPWAGRNRFLERVLSVEEFRRLYRARLETLLATQFVPARLHRRIDELAGIVREAVAAESDFRKRKFERAVGAVRGDSKAEVEQAEDRDESDDDVNRSAHQLKRFVTNRARFVRNQLDGKSDGVILEHRRRD